MYAPERPASALPRWMPGPVLLGILVVGAVLAFVAVARGPIDADYFWHLRTGRLILESGLPATDPYSFTYDGPWVLHEWLGEVIIGGLVGTVGEAVTLVAFGIVAALALAIPALAIRESTGTPRTAAIVIATTLAAVVVVSFVTIRPQVLSWLVLGVLVALLVKLGGNQPRRSLLLIPLFILWANLHGLYVVGLGIVAIYALLTLVGATPMSTARGWMSASAVGAVLASMATPAGPAGLLYPFRYLEPSDWGLANIQEWQSPDFHDPANLGLLVLLVALVLVAAQARPTWLRFVAAAGAALALLSVRNAPVAAVLAVPALALGLDAILPASRPVRATARTPRRVMEMGLALIVIAAAATLLLPRAATWSDTLNRSYPVAGAEALERANPAARVLADYGWGGYLIGQLSAEGVRVFVDGRNDMYPDQVLTDYSSLRAAQDGWQQLADAYGVDAILMPPTAPIVEAAKSAGWCEGYRDEVQVLLLTACRS